MGAHDNGAAQSPICRNAGCKAIVSGCRSAPCAAKCPTKPREDLHKSITGPLSSTSCLAEMMSQLILTNVNTMASAGLVQLFQSLDLGIPLNFSFAALIMISSKLADGSPNQIASAHVETVILALMVLGSKLAPLLKHLILSAGSPHVDNAQNSWPSEI